MLNRMRGFSLIELMLVVGILAILFAIAMPNFSSWMASTRMRLKAESMLAGIHMARSNAIQHNARVAFQVNPDSSWTVGCVNPVADRIAGTVVVEVGCPAVIEQKVASEGGTNVTVTITPTPADPAVGTILTFSGLGRPVGNADASASLTQIDLTETGVTANGAQAIWRIVISAAGQARICNPARNGTGDPYACA